MRHGRLLTVLNLLGLLGGVAVGLLLHEPGGAPSDHMELWRQAGELVLVRPLALLAVPLALVAVTASVAGLGGASRLGVLGGATLVYLMTAMVLAASAGLGLALLMQPGAGIPREAVHELRAAGDLELGRAPALVEAAQDAADRGLGGAWLDLLSQASPRSLVEEMARGRLLGVMAFAAAVGLALALGRERTAPAVRVLDALLEALLAVARWALWLAPAGVFLMVTAAIGARGTAVLGGPLGWYAATVAAALALHALVILPLALWMVGRTSPFRYMAAMLPGLAAALGAGASAAALPATLRCALAGGCSRRAGGFVLPLAASLKLDGSALWVTVAAIFLFQLHGIDLSFGELLIVAVAATVTSVGAPGPYAGLVGLAVVLSAVNTSLAGRGVAELPLSAIGMLAVADRLLAPLRSAVDAWSDAVGARILSRLAPDEPETG